jgi:hypothetical protein
MLNTDYISKDEGRGATDKAMYRELAADTVI